MQQWGNLSDFERLTGCNITSLKRYIKTKKIPNDLIIVDFGLHQLKYRVNLQGLLAYMKNNRRTFRRLIKDKF